MTVTVVYEFETRRDAEAVAAAAILLPAVVKMVLERDPHVVTVDIDLSQSGTFDAVTREMDSVAPSMRRSFSEESANLVKRGITLHEGDS
jgi:hypothetical protein